MNLCITFVVALQMWVGMPGMTHIISVNAPGVYVRGVEVPPDQPIFVRDVTYLQYRGSNQEATNLTICPGYLVFLPLVR